MHSMFVPWQGFELRSSAQQLNCSVATFLPLSHSYHSFSIASKALPPTLDQLELKIFPWQGFERKPSGVEVSDRLATEPMTIFGRKQTFV